MITGLMWKVCFAFIKIGAFSFGGGYAVLAFIQREVVEANGWLTAEQYVNMIAIAEMTPGPMAVNSSTFVGYNLFGVGGGVLSTICVLAVPFTLALIVSIYFNKFKDSLSLKKALSGIRPAVIGLIGAAAISVGQASLSDLYSVGFFLFALLLVGKVKLNPIITLVICGGLGALFYGYLLPLI